MSRLPVIALLSAFTASACATSASTKRSYVPETEVTVKTVKRKAAQANYQVGPEASRNGSGGGVEK